MTHVTAVRTARLLLDNAPLPGVDAFVARMVGIAREQRDPRCESFWREVAALVREAVASPYPNGP